MENHGASPLRGSNVNLKQVVEVVDQLAMAAPPQGCRVDSLGRDLSLGPPHLMQMHGKGYERGWRD